MNDPEPQTPSDWRLEMARDELKLLRVDMSIIEMKIHACEARIRRLTPKTES